MEIYLVGGAVRDQLLGLPVTDRDWVVVGATEAEMRGLGYHSVGKDFPVFLHPESHEEYALARIERKIGEGHTGFACDTNSITLEDDLKRRDLTINAIAQDKAGNLIDPWGGQHDLTQRVLRHVSAAFAEDPLRILRVARFAARFKSLGFTIHPSTLALMRTMVGRGDLAELPPERIWQELEKALATSRPDVFIKTLEQTGAGDVLWPEIVPNAAVRLEQMTRKTADPLFRYAALLLELTPQQAQTLGKRLRVPNRFTDFARLASAHYSRWCEGVSLGAQGTLDLLYSIDAFRQAGRFQDLNRLLCLISGTPDADLIAEYWLNCAEIARQVTASTVEPGLKGKDIGDAIRAEQARQIAVNLD